MKQSGRKKKRKLWLIPVIIVVALVVIFLVYVSGYSKADETALGALESDDAVAVTQTDYGWFFDGPSDETALVFYPGGKVDEKAYAPLLHQLAENGVDVSLVKMPFHLAIFGKDKADDLIGQEAYEHWYIGGHSLGGAMAAVYAAEHGDALDGVIMCAAYPTKQLDADLTEVLIYGSKDGVVNMEKMEDGAQYASSDVTEHVIEGGNHAQFGNYGAQKGDNPASISAEEQQTETVETILNAME